jgi:DNA invertase Pin-like site-specific DNA recombinase
MRFAFYGRVSTEDQQDPTSSRNWQLARARPLIQASGGSLVAEFFDIGQSRSLPWQRRPQAAALLDSFKDPRRGFDAIVIGEPARAFYDNQFGLTFPIFVHYGVELWVPEVGGRVDPGSEAHDLVMSLYGGMSKGERNRIKIRVRAAMAEQAATGCRFLGGRPPAATVWSTPAPTPTPARPRQASGYDASSPTRSPHRWSSASSPSGWPAAACAASPKALPGMGSSPPAPTTPPATATGP